MERRQFPRMNVNLPMWYCFGLQEPKEGSNRGGFLTNISHGGMYFKCAPPPSLEAGSTGDFTVEITSNKGFTTRLNTLGKVIRMEPLTGNSFNFGVAVQFLSDLKVELRR